MTRFAIDAPVALRLAGEKATPSAQHQLVGPGRLRSDVLASLYHQVRAGEHSQRQAQDLLDQIAATKMRLLSDRVSRRVAWQIATALDLGDTRLAEYVAVARLQADVLITDETELGRIAGDADVPVAGWALLAGALA